MAITAIRVVFGAAGIVAVGALTPGPNNLIVLERAARRGFGSAVPAIAAITCGSVALILAVGSAGAVMFEGRHWLRAAVSVGGCAYLSWLGLRLLVKASDESPAPSRLWPDTTWKLFVFQFMNPKAWAIALTASAALEEYRSLGTALLELAMLFAVIPAACLLLWSAAGAALAKYLQHSHIRLMFERLLGVLLLGSAVAVVL
ncbi:MAG TPA: LysE family translocator [Steroidobacteraceae bacterium]|nr:LysE family translocator [Steroidobacteraceae bacterium]